MQDGQAVTAKVAWDSGLTASCPKYWPLVIWEGRNGKENGNYYNGLYRDYYKDPFLHS